jgi:hypothetical protein
MFAVITVPHRARIGWNRAPGTGSVAGAWLNISIAAVPANTPLFQQARFFKLLTTSWWDAAVSWWVTRNS